MFNRIYQNFCFLVKRMCRIFLIHLKLFFFWPLLPPSFLKFWGPIPIGALGNCLIRLRVEPALIEKEVKELDFLVWCNQENKIREKTFGPAKEDRSGLLGVGYVWYLGKISPPTFSTHSFNVMDIIYNGYNFIKVRIYMSVK